MQVRTVQFHSKNPLVVVAILAIVLALLLFFLSTMLAVGAGAALLGGAGYGVRRLFRGRALGTGAAREARPALDPAREVFPDAAVPRNALPPRSQDPDAPR